VLSLGEGWMSLITGSDFSRSNLLRTFIGVELPASASERKLVSPA